MTVTDHSSELAAVAGAMVAPPKGILAIDETPGTIGKRFEAQGIEATPENRAAYRALLCSAPGLSDHVSGVILQDETIRQEGPDGTQIIKMLEAQGIFPGIKIDLGVTELAGFPDEKITNGLDGIDDRAAEYRELGARFAKWRAVISIGPDRPSKACITANAHALARYAASCQKAGLVPIVEPEVLMEGDHSGSRCAAVTVDVLTAVFEQLEEERVQLEGIVLKPNMITAGASSSDQLDVEQVAKATVACLREVVPPQVPGVAFLSGGQPAQLATQHLNAMNTGEALPWWLTFSFGRALQDPVLKLWAGDAANVEAAQAVLVHRTRCNSAATVGSYEPSMEDS